MKGGMKHISAEADVVRSFEFDTTEPFVSFEMRTSCQSESVPYQYASQIRPTPSGAAEGQRIVRQQCGRESFSPRSLVQLKGNRQGAAQAQLCLPAIPHAHCTAKETCCKPSPGFRMCGVRFSSERKRLGRAVNQSGRIPCWPLAGFARGLSMPTVFLALRDASNASGPLRETGG